MPRTSQQILAEGFRRYGKHLLTLLTLGFMLGMGKTWIEGLATSFTDGLRTDVSSNRNLHMLLTHLPFELTYQAMAACLMLLMAQKILRPAASLWRGCRNLFGQIGTLGRLAVIHTLVATIVAIPLELLQSFAATMPQWNAIAGALLGALVCWLLAGAYMLLPLALAVPALAVEDLRGWTFLRRVYQLAKNHWFLLLKVKLLELSVFAIPALGIIITRSWVPLKSVGLGYPLFMISNWTYYALLPLSAALVTQVYEHCCAAKKGAASVPLQRAA